MQRTVISTHSTFENADRARNLFLHTNHDQFPHDGNNDPDPQRKVVQIRRKNKGTRFDLVIRK